VDAENKQENNGAINNFSIIFAGLTMRPFFAIYDHAVFGEAFKYPKRRRITVANRKRIAYLRYGQDKIRYN